MSARQKYNTRHRESLLDFFKNHADTVYSARELIENTELGIGEATVFRLLAGLSKEGFLRKIPAETGNASRYRYDGEKDSETRCLLKCTECGGTISASCGFLDELERHMGDDHDFYMNPEKTVIFGLCGNCHGHNRRK